MTRQLPLPIKLIIWMGACLMIGLFLEQMLADYDKNIYRRLRPSARKVARHNPRKTDN